MFTCFWTLEALARTFEGFFQCLSPVFPLNLLNTPLILQVSRLFPFPLDFMLLGFPFPLYPPSQAQLSSVCGGVSPVPPVLSLSRSIKRRRTHAGRLKSPPTLPYGWWAGRCSNRTAPSRQEEHPSHLLVPSPLVSITAARISFNCLVLYLWRRVNHFANNRPSPSGVVVAAVWT